MLSLHFLSIHDVDDVADAIFVHFLPAPLNVSQISFVPLYAEHGSTDDIHPFPLDKHPFINDSHSESVVADVLS